MKLFRLITFLARVVPPALSDPLAAALGECVYLVWRSKRLAHQKMPTAEVFMADFTPVMGVHTGPGVIGLTFYYE